MKFKAYMAAVGLAVVSSNISATDTTLGYCETCEDLELFLNRVAQDGTCTVGDTSCGGDGSCNIC